MKTKIVLLFGLISTLLLSGCGFYKPVTVGKIKGLKLDELSFEAIKFKLIVPVENPNSYKFQITDSELEISINNRPLTNITTDKAMIVPKNFKGDLEFPVTVKLKGMFDAATIAIVELFGRRGAEIAVNGWLKVKVFGITKKFKVEEKSNVSIFKNNK